jgi:hypothetical protein
VTNCFSTDTIFLGREVEGDVVGLEDATDRCGCAIEGGFANGEGDVPQSKGVGLRVGAALAVLPGAEKEKESHDGQIGDGPWSDGVTGELGGDGLQVDEQLEGYRADSSRRWVLFVVRAKLPGEAEIGNAESVVPRVRGPHAGKDLGHGAKVLLDGPLANGATVGGKLACSDAVSEHLKERDGVVHAGKGRVETQFGAEGAPLPPVGPIGGRSA